MAAAKVGTGAVIGALSKNAPSTLHGIGMGSVNASAKFAHGARKALSANHKNVGGAIAAGTAAVLGHGALAGRTFLTDRSINPARRRYRKRE